MVGFTPDLEFITIIGAKKILNPDAGFVNGLKLPTVMQYTFELLLLLDLENDLTALTAMIYFMGSFSNSFRMLVSDRFCLLNRDFCPWRVGKISRRLYE